jgi:hypothetical protein
VLVGVSLSLGGSLLLMLGYLLLAATLALLCLDEPPARPFGGRIGAALGCAFGALAVVAARHDSPHVSFMVVPLILSRDHLVRLCGRLGHSERSIALAHCAATAANGCFAFWMVRIGGSSRAAVFLPVLMAHVAYSLWVLRRARRAGLLGAS